MFNASCCATDLSLTGARCSGWGGVRTPVLQIALDLTIYLAKRMSKNISEHCRLLCSPVMRGEYSSSTRQTVLVRVFTKFDPQPSRAKRVFRSTKISDRKQALEICRAWQKAALLARNGKLSVDAACDVIAQGVADVFTHANVESSPSASIRSWCETWTEAKAIETEESTHARYRRVIEPVLPFSRRSEKQTRPLHASSERRCAVS